MRDYIVVCPMPTVLGMHYTWKTADNKTGWIHDHIVGQPEQGLSQNIEHLPANYPKIHNFIPMNRSMGTMVEQPIYQACHTRSIRILHIHCSITPWTFLYSRWDRLTNTHGLCKDVVPSCNSSKIVCQACIDFPTAYLLLPVSTEQEAHKLLLANVLWLGLQWVSQQ